MVEELLTHDANVRYDDTVVVSLDTEVKFVNTFGLGTKSSLSVW